VGHFYCNFLTEEFYTTLSKERNPRYAQARATLLDMERTLGAQVHTVEAGDVIQVDELSFEVLRVPSLEQAADMNMNDSSVVYKMTYDGAQTMMLLGDAEWVCSNDLTENCRDKLKSDIVQVGHHGCGNVSAECYDLISAKAYIWQTGEKFWYSDCGEGLNTHNTGVIRTRAYMMRQQVDLKNVYVAMDDIISLPLPMKIY
jgi:beta-lactamase superfamily II metal-dependent hydrolase